MHGVLYSQFPWIEIEIFGAAPLNRQKIWALIDTGFNGDLQLPLQAAIPLGLILSGVEDFKLADDSSKSYLMCQGTVILEDKSAIANILLQDKGNILIGTALLKKLEKGLVIDFVNNTVQVITVQPAPQVPAT